MSKKKDINREDLNKKQDPGEMPEEPVDEKTEEKEGKTEEKEGKTEEKKEISDETQKDGAKSKEEESFETKYLRMAADFQNFKRRTEDEKSRIYANANEAFANDLLAVLDNFERAIEQDRNNEADEPFLTGMEMILKQLEDVLKKNGIAEIDALGKEFDPNYHHAVAMEKSDEYKKGCVCNVMQKGYILNDRVIRPCMVKVSE